MKASSEYPSSAHKAASALLADNDEWIKRYIEYGNKIKEQSKSIIEQKKQFHEWPPLYLYSTVTDAMGSGGFSLRYQGQNVAKLKVNKKGVFLSTTPHLEANIKYFGCNIDTFASQESPSAPWALGVGKDFRKFFSGRPIRIKVKLGKKNNEHRIESAILTELTKHKKTDKSLPYIQPVKIADVARFQMPTPLKASVKEILYSKAHGGGVDILARVGRGGGTCLAVIEVKDENKAAEPPAKAIEQAIAYATFIHALLRDPIAGPIWWELFGFKGDLPRQLKILTACAMPKDAARDGSDFEGRRVSLDGRKSGDFLELHSMFFTETGDAINIEASWLVDPEPAGSAISWLSRR